ncbi:MAG: class I SAM-dependent methyltransferase [Actinomycetia bacterium]|nr:class I SAM-dependent methyltransferase [Actinomycetes bacterium]
MALWQDRWFAWIYPRTEPALERELGSLRRELWAAARGRTLLVGAGTGLDLAYVPASVTELTLVDPHPGLLATARARARRLSMPWRAVQGRGEALPVDDASQDTVVATLVLCSVEDPRRVLAEAHRVLRPGGALLALEHVASERPWERRLQGVLTGLWRHVAGGCRLDRPTDVWIAGDPGWSVKRRRRERHLGVPWVLVHAVRVDAERGHADR